MAQINVTYSNYTFWQPWKNSGVRQQHIIGVHQCSDYDNLTCHKSHNEVCQCQQRGPTSTPLPSAKKVHVLFFMQIIYSEQFRTICNEPIRLMKKKMFGQGMPPTLSPPSVRSCLPWVNKMNDRFYSKFIEYNDINCIYHFKI